MDYYSSLDSRSLDSTPTIFEIISSNELEHLLSPSLRYIVVHYAQKYPSLFLKLAMNFDELNLVIRGLIEHHYLKSWNSSFTENFYGLKRQTLNKIDIKDSNHKIFDIVEQKKRLSQWQIYGSLINLVGGAYINEKLDVLYERLHAKILLKTLKPTTLINKLKIYFVKIYPYILSTIKLLNVIFQILYLSGRTKSPSFIDYLLKIEYSRLSKFDYDLHDTTTKPQTNTTTTSKTKTNSRPPSFGQHLTSMIQVYQKPIKSLIMKLSTTIFPLAIFLLKFLEWWNSSEFASKISKNQQNIIDKDIPPPKTLKTITKSSNCPICKDVIHNPAIIETGYVFCYTCIMKFLIDGDEKIGGRCPITGKRLLGCRYSNGLKEWKIDGVRRLMI
ncbi:Peroxisome assembly protein 12 [Wickerhamomyces ciferrii]|uniref:Peroxisome assembly protein 12 n=1 Tax=Wickerhamomyces ciferrii (strain ATCC 14091 / BCRC 22168 / CBS 111 / JCM 3599 / NBRC 0793 / NRRL Y-1031 F-60-10) TaxID=1206466 RepID=K0KDP7_WICCF|nr:Peroxisome assembly protein 12 [Wickerhamomyces ciferrii]CCH43235.1 Peroxisome assembly protein 12 [Wickerhamomyces ciferrii]